MSKRKVQAWAVDFEAGLGRRLRNPNVLRGFCEEAMRANGWKFPDPEAEDNARIARAARRYARADWAAWIRSDEDFRKLRRAIERADKRKGKKK